MATTFGSEVDFLSKHTDVIVLDSCRPALVAVAPAFQGRVMTSTPAGKEGPSLGWINRAFLEAGQRNTVFDNYGGEDRFWIGPEGGQFGLWFGKGDPFELAHWRTPEGLNAGRFEVTSRGRGSVALAARFDLVNRAGTRFELAVKRVIDVLAPDRVAAELGATCPAGVSCVAFQSVNVLANVGPKPWTPSGGLLSVWTLGQFNPLARGLVIVPFVAGPAAELGPPPNGEYFGKPPRERFWLDGGHAFFRVDGRFRAKLGVSRGRSRNVLSSFDPDTNTLTVVQFNLPGGAARLPYVNSLWEEQKQPYAGDVVNSYNDGPATPGADSLGGFYEIETSSPAAALAPEESLAHVHRTFHFTGDLAKVNALALRILGVDLATVEFPKA